MELAVGLDPKAALYSNLGTLRLARGEREEAEAAFRTAPSALEPKSVDRPPRARQLSVGDRPAGRSRSGAEGGVRGATRRTCWRNRVLATFYLASGRAAEAEPFLVTVASAGRTAGARLGLASYYASVGRAADARRGARGSGEDAARLGGRAVPPRRAAARRRSGRPGAGDDRRGPEAGAANAEALLTKTRILLARGRPDDAPSWCGRRSPRIRPARTAHYLLGTILGVARRPRGRGEGLQRSAAAQPARRRRLRAAGAHRAAARRARGLGADGVAAITQDPDNAMARLMLARALLAQRRPAQAAPEIDRLLKAYPNGAADPRAGRRAAGAAGRSPRRARAFERALALDPASADALSALTSLDVREGRARRRGPASRRGWRSGRRMPPCWCWTRAPRWR